jgi:ferrous iron transport protein A
MSLSKGKINKVYTIGNVDTKDEGMRTFLFTLGCYPGETVTIISKLASNYVINIKNARYSIDEQLAKAILV